MIPTTRSRAYREGKASRRRTIRCRNCNKKVKFDTVGTVREDEKYCPTCRILLHLSVYKFTNKNNPAGEITYITAPDFELATLRAWKINPDLRQVLNSSKGRE